MTKFARHTGCRWKAEGWLMTTLGAMVLTLLAATLTRRP